jgi:hypothetical protein
LPIQYVWQGSFGVGIFSLRRVEKGPRSAGLLMTSGQHQELRRNAL